jgi:hypothetical protein
VNGIQSADGDGEGFQSSLENRRDHLQDRDKTQ